MFIVIEMIMIISLFSAMGILLGLFLAKIRCRKREKLYYRNPREKFVKMSLLKNLRL